MRTTKNHCNMKDSNHPKVNIGDYIEITARRCSDKVSPLLQIGKKFFVKELSALGNGALVLIVKHPNRKNDVLRVNAERFDWKAVTLAQVREDEFVEKVASNTKKMQEVLTLTEQMRIAFVPLIIAELAWIYAEDVVDYSAKHRIGFLKKLSRMVKGLREKYMADIRKDLDYAHTAKIRTTAVDFREEYDKDFKIFYFTINKLFKKSMPDYPHDTMRSTAILSMFMIKFFDEHNKRMDKILVEKIGDTTESQRPPTIDSLYTCMEAFAGEVGKFDYSDQELELNMRILEKNFNNVEFSILDNGTEK